MGRKSANCHEMPGRGVECRTGRDPRLSLFHKHLLRTYYVPGAVLGSGDTRMKSTMCLPSWRLRSGCGWLVVGGGEADGTQRYLVSCQVIIRAKRKHEAGQVTGNVWFRNGRQGFSEEVKLHLNKGRQEPCEYVLEETSRQRE